MNADGDDALQVPQVLQVLPHTGETVGSLVTALPDAPASAAGTTLARVSGRDGESSGGMQVAEVSTTVDPASAGDSVTRVHEGAHESDRHTRDDRHDDDDDDRDDRDDRDASELDGAGVVDATVDAGATSATHADTAATDDGAAS